MPRPYCFMKKLSEISLTTKITVIISAAVVCLTVLLTMLFMGVGGDKKTPTSASSSSVGSSSDPSSSGTSSAESSSEEVVSENTPPEITLAVTAPSAADITVNVPYYTIKGSGEAGQELTVNDIAVALDANGFFSYDISLNEGENAFVIKHKGKTETYIIRYKKTIIKDVYPSSATSVESASELTVSAVALLDSTVTASFNGQTVTLYKADNNDGSLGEYADFVGSFTMPVNTGSAKSYGKISFTAASSSGTGSKTSGSITVKTFDATKYDGGNGYPANCGYLNVGKTLVAEVISTDAETFNASDATDLSRPTNNYLPKGTVDYCSPYPKTFRAGGQTVELHTLRYGKQLYKETNNTGTNIKIYEGALPDTNTVALDSADNGSRYTALTFDVDWKAPFTLELLDQAYKNTSSANRNYAISSATFSYVDITFAYANELEALIDFTDNRLFSSSEVIYNEYDCTLRLRLKEVGKFYGWSAEYNSAGQLVFSFLNPVTLKEADNGYGYSLEGITVVVDAGHGGIDGGASGFISGKHEAQLNLFLAKELERQLTELGATVVMTRTDNSGVSASDRINTIRQAQPDFLISIHRNGGSSSANGFSSYYFNPFSASAANALYDATKAQGLYNSSSPWSFVRWHVFFLCRTTYCPSVLTENGYVTNRGDYNKMLDETENQKCAAALIDGMIDYFKKH